MEQEHISRRTWFFTFLCANMPIIGWFYLLYLAYSKTPNMRRDYARAFLLYKLLFLFVSLILLGILIYLGAGALDQLFTYMEMLSSKDSAAHTCFYFTMQSAC